MKQELQKKIDRAVWLIQSAAQAAERMGQVIEVCYSGGKDSDVILELTRMAGVKYRAIYKNTTIDPPGTIKHVQDNNVEIIRPKETFYQLMCRKGFPSRTVRFCCDVLKEYKILDYTIVGVRADESRKRQELYTEPEMCRVYNNKDEVHQFVPIRDWTINEVNEFIKERGIRCAPVYYDEQGVFHPERRLGCMCCPLASMNKRLEDFKKYPNMIKMYCRAGSIYRKNHPNSPNNEKFSNVYELLCFTLYTNTMGEFKEKFGKSLFDDGIDCKAFLEQQFNIKL